MAYEEWIRVKAQIKTKPLSKENQNTHRAHSGIPNACKKFSIVKLLLGRLCFLFQRYLLIHPIRIDAGGSCACLLFICVIIFDSIVPYSCTCYISMKKEAIMIIAIINKCEYSSVYQR